MRVPASEFGPWPGGVALQIHMMEGDRLVVDEGDLDAARALAADVEGAELVFYPGPGSLYPPRRQNVRRRWQDECPMRRRGVWEYAAHISLRTDQRDRRVMTGW